MARLQSNRPRSNSLQTQYADWLDWNLSKVVLAALWLVFMGVWFARSVVRALANGGGLGTPVVVPGRNGTFFAASALWVGALTAVCLLAGIVLLVSCFAVRRGWLKRSE